MLMMTTKTMTIMIMINSVRGQRVRLHFDRYAALLRHRRGNANILRRVVTANYRIYSVVCKSTHAQNMMATHIVSDEETT